MPLAQRSLKICLGANFEEFRLQLLSPHYCPNFTALKGHIESAHERKKRFHCVVCDASFERKNALDGHNASIHNMHEPFYLKEEIKGDFEDTK